MSAGRLIAYDRELHLETYDEPVVGDVFDVIRGNGPREGDYMGTATVAEFDERGDPVLSVHFGDRGD